ncbi:MAG: hypothetical protein ABFQ95_01145 [Pseudomonadota bacterium]
MPKPNNFNRTINQRLNKFIVPFVMIRRAPLSTDIKDPRTGKYYEPPHLWVVDRNPTDSSTEGDLWYLADINSNVADWKLISTSSTPGGTVTSLEGDSGGEVGPTSGVIDINGKTVANATNSKALHFKGTPASSLLDAEIQLASSNVGAPADSNKAGVCLFDSTNFSVDANGYVTLVGVSGSNEFIDNVFRILDDLDNTKKIAFQADQITTGTVRTITMRDSDLDLANVVEGPATAVDENLAIYDGTTGKLIKDSGISISDISTFSWREETGTSATFVANEGIFANNASTVTLTLPASCSIGDTFIAYQEGAGKVRVAQNASDVIRFNGNLTTTGVGGYIESLNQGDSVTFVCAGTNKYRVISSETSWTVV